MTTPRCPFCNAQGLQHLKRHDAGLFFVVYCDKCGAIYGVIPNFQAQSQPAAVVTAPPPAPSPHLGPAVPLKPVLPKATPPPVETSNGISPATLQDALERFGNTDLLNLDGPTPRQIKMQMKAAFARSGTRYRQIVIDDGPPLCLTHWIEMKKITIPQGYKNGGCQLWICPQHQECRRWAMADE